MDQPPESKGLPLEYESPSPARLHPLIHVLVAVAALAVLVGLLLPTMTPRGRPSPKAWCASNLRTLGLYLINYAANHKGRFPDSLPEMILDTAGGGHGGMYVCPASAQRPAASATTQQFANDIANKPQLHLSYVYVGKGLKLGRNLNPARTVLLFEPLSHHGNGINVVYADGHCDFVPKGEAEKLIAELQAGFNRARAEKLR